MHNYPAKSTPTLQCLVLATVLIMHPNTHAIQYCMHMHPSCAVPLDTSGITKGVQGNRSASVKYTSVQVSHMHEYRVCHLYVSATGPDSTHARLRALLSWCFHPIHTYPAT